MALALMLDVGDIPWDDAPLLELGIEPRKTTVYVPRAVSRAWGDRDYPRRVPRISTPTKVVAVVGLLVAAVVAVLFLVPVDGEYLFLPDEPHPVDPLVEVEGSDGPDQRGEIYFVDVLVRRPTVFERLFPGVHDGASLVPAEDVNPGGLSEEARRQSSLRVMTRSQRIAAAVALRHAGFDVVARARGVFVAQVLPESPAAEKLQPSDVILAVDGEAVRGPVELRRRLDDLRPGDGIELRVRRGRETQRIELRLASDPGNARRGIIGVLVEPEVDVRLPVDVEIDAGNVGGPSAGLAFALGLLEELGRDVDHGRRVAVTGELGLDGRVGPVGGIRQKTIGARDANVDVFLVPAGENAEEARRHADGLRVVPVRSFQQALRALATLEE